MKRHERLNHLVEEHLPIVAIVCRENRGAVDKLGRDEAEAIGQLALVEASRSWKQLGCFGAYAKVLIRFAIQKAAKPTIPQVPLNGYDPEDKRDWFYDGPVVASVLTVEDRQFMQHIEDAHLSPDDAHRVLARRRKRKTAEIKRRHQRIMLRIAEESRE